MNQTSSSAQFAGAPKASHRLRLLHASGSGTMLREECTTANTSAQCRRFPFCCTEIITAVTVQTNSVTIAFMIDHVSKAFSNFCGISKLHSASPVRRTGSLQGRSWAP